MELLQRSPGGSAADFRIALVSVVQNTLQSNQSTAVYVWGGFGVRLQAFDEIDSDVYSWASKDKVIILEEDLEIGEIGLR